MSRVKLLNGYLIYISFLDHSFVHHRVIWNDAVNGRNPAPPDLGYIKPL